MLTMVRAAADRMVERVVPRVEADALRVTCDCTRGGYYRWIQGSGCDAWGNKYTQKCTNSTCGTCSYYKCGWVCS